MSYRIPHRGVVVGVDGSSSAVAAVRWAAHEAVMRNLPLTVVHVEAALPVTASVLAWPAGRIPEEVLEIEENEARAIVVDAVKTAESCSGGERLKVSSEHYFGSPIAALTDLSKDSEMIVVACRGRAGRHRRLLGSVSAGVLHHAHCPVALIHDEFQPARSERLPVLVGVDDSRASQAALLIAFEEASLRGVDLVALHVWSDADMSSIPSLEWSALRRVAEKNLAESLAGYQERYPDVNVGRLVEYDNPALHLVEQAERAQLVVVGSHGRGGFVGMVLGSVSATVAQEVCIPVIVARK
ncbi:MULTISPECIES: universal stress protein [unclassified Mycolicibacterium]|uniref:universal stress protein n=1 Tax=unclassified Mycolicibacterium TaxID=2636767 RepID=UPI002ED8D5C4